MLRKEKFIRSKNIENIMVARSLTEFWKAVKVVVGKRNASGVGLPAAQLKNHFMQLLNAENLPIQINATPLTLGDQLDTPITLLEIEESTYSAKCQGMTESRSNYLKTGHTSSKNSSQQYLTESLKDLKHLISP